MAILHQLICGSYPSGYDSDAQAIITAIEATDAGAQTSAKKTAINDFVVSVKAASIWSSMIAVYGYIGGTAASHAINWKSPGTYNITWNGTLTHNANGVTGDGSTGYGNTGILARTAGTNDYGLYSGNNKYDISYGVYLRSGSFLAGARRSMNGPDDRSYCIGVYQSDKFYGQVGSNEDLCYSTPSSYSGMFSVSGWDGGTDIRLYRNGSEETRVVNTPTKVDVGVDAYFYLLATHRYYSGASYFKNGNMSMFYITNNNITSTDASNLYNAVQTLQTALGRQV